MSAFADAKRIMDIKWTSTLQTWEFKCFPQKSSYIGFTRVTPKHTETNNKEFIKSEFWTFLFKPFSYLVLGVVQLRKIKKNNYYR